MALGLLPVRLFPGVQDTAAPRRFKVGDPEVNVRVFRPFRSIWRELEIKPGGQREVGTYSEELTFAEYQGRAVLQDQQAYLTGPSPGSYTVILDRLTLAPIQARITDDRDGSYARFDFQIAQVEIECKGAKCPRIFNAPAGETVRKTIPVETPVFEFFQVSFGTLLAALPLHERLTYELPVFHPARGTLWLRVEVKEQEEIECEGKRVKAWRVVTPQTGYIMHVSDQPPYWLRFESTRPDGTKQVYDRIAEKSSVRKEPSQ